MEEIKLIKDIKDIVIKQDADTISNRLMNAKVELNTTRNFLNDAGNFRTDDYDMGLSCEVILSKYIEYLQYKVKMLEKIHTKLQNNKYIKRDEAPGLTTVPKKRNLIQRRKFLTLYHIQVLIMLICFFYKKV